MDHTLNIKTPKCWSSKANRYKPLSYTVVLPQLTRLYYSSSDNYNS